MFQSNSIMVTLLENGVAELTFDLQTESVNKFNTATVLDLSQAIDTIEQSENVKGVLITSNKSVFIVGADITEFVPILEAGSGATEHLMKNAENFNRIEDLKVPTVVAINGFAVGGGLEFVLACDYRIMSETARIGLPEVKLGLIPGWGGSVRLPRLAGVDTAIDWIASGKDQKAQDALKAGVVDGVVAPDNLRNAAISALNDCIAGKFDFQSRRQQKKEPLKLSQTELTMAFETAKAFVANKAGPNYPAPLTAIDCMQASAGLQRDEALIIERAGFEKMMKTDAAKALVGIFLNDQLVSKKAKKWAKQAVGQVKQAAVLGAGIMGGGIAYQSALKGIPIKMKDIAQSGLDLGLSEANKLLSKQVDRGRMSVDAMGKMIASIDATLSYEHFESADIVVEAVKEDPRIKQIVLAEVEKNTREDAIIASNTSTISISLLAQSLQRPENFCGMHFFNPVHAMPLVEVIRGEKTSNSTIAKTVAYANALGKKAIVINDCPGFLVNRVLFPYFAGFMGLLKEGADFVEVDTVMEKWGWPMGPAYLMDVVGIDTAVHAESVMEEGFPDRMAKHFKTAGDVLFDNEWLGQKSKEGGFYTYEKDKRGKPKKVLNEKVYELLSPHCEPTKAFSEEEIIARMMLPMATELARCLDEGIIDSVAEADMALIYGVGFPAFRGGIFRWIDTIGSQKFVQMCDQYKSLGGLYQATQSQIDLAQKNGKYYV